MKNTFHSSSCLSQSVVTKFKDIVPSLLSFSMPYPNTVQRSHLNSIPTKVILLIVHSQCISHIAWTPLKKTTSNQKYLTPWYNLQLCKLKPATKIDLHLALNKSLLLYKKALCKGRTPYYLLLTGKKRSTPDFMSAL